MRTPVLHQDIDMRDVLEIIQKKRLPKDIITDLYWDTKGRSLRLGQIKKLSIFKFQQLNTFPFIFQIDFL